MQLQTTSTDTWLPANLDRFIAPICWLLSGSEQNNCQQMDEPELIHVGQQTSGSLKLDGIRLMIIVFWNSFKDTTHLFNKL